MPAHRSREGSDDHAPRRLAPRHARDARGARRVDRRNHRRGRPLRNPCPDRSIRIGQDPGREAVRRPVVSPRRRGKSAGIDRQGIAGEAGPRRAGGPLPRPGANRRHRRDRADLRDHERRPGDHRGDVPRRPRLRGRDVHRRRAARPVGCRRPGARGPGRQHGVPLQQPLGHRAQDRRHVRLLDLGAFYRPARSPSSTRT